MDNRQPQKLGQAYADTWTDTHEMILKWKKWETKLHRHPSFICLKHVNTEKAYTE